MNKSLFLMLVIFLCISREKNAAQILRFSPSTAATVEPINYDSIDFTTITYSDLSEPNDSHTVKLNIRKEHLNLVSGHTYSFKQFNMVGKSGKVLYYIPSKTDTTSKGIFPRLPINFRIQDDSGAILVVRVVPNRY